VDRNTISPKAMFLSRKKNKGANYNIMGRANLCLSTQVTKVKKGFKK